MGALLGAGEHLAHPVRGEREAGGAPGQAGKALAPPAEQVRGQHALAEVDFQPGQEEPGAGHAAAGAMGGDELGAELGGGVGVERGGAGAGARGTRHRPRPAGGVGLEVGEGDGAVERHGGHGAP
ncbi:MAG: hypothetical protein ACXU86_15030 [Archangium sp.]